MKQVDWYKMGFNAAAKGDVTAEDRYDEYMSIHPDDSDSQKQFCRGLVDGEAYKTNYIASRKAGVI